MLDMLRSGGNAVDAAMAGAITQATVQLDMTNHTGTVSFLYWEAKTGKTYQLNSMGTLVAHLPPFRTYPPGLGGVAAGAPMACIPGFMPGVAAIHARFGSKPWKALVEPAIPWAEHGHPMDEFTRSVLEYELEGNTFFPSMREIYAPDGFTPSVGELWKNPALAKTLRRLADEGPEYFTKGEWAQHFVSTANQLGWQIKLGDMTATPPRWQDPMRCGVQGLRHRAARAAGAPGAVLQPRAGDANHLGVASIGHWSESAESLYYVAQAMRRADFELGQLHDPEHFDVPLDVWSRRRLPRASRDHPPEVAPQARRRSHEARGADDVALAAPGIRLGDRAAPNPKPKEPSGSCELACVDKDGNWVQMMDTLQSAASRNGVRRRADDRLSRELQHGRLDRRLARRPKLRMRSVMGSTLVMKDGKPVLSMGTPGNVHCTIPQMLLTVLDFKKDPYEATVLPRMLPMRDDYTVEIENRIPSRVLADLAKIGREAQAAAAVRLSHGIVPAGVAGFEDGPAQCRERPAESGSGRGILIGRLTT